MNDIRFAIVLVTYNRLECLKIALKKYDNQTKPPAYILVIDNASNDGTKEYLDHWMQDKTEKYKKIVIHCEKNTGGSGGFSLGVEKGLKLDCDFLFLADDDAYAEPDMLENLEKGYLSLQGKKISAICTAILNRDRYEIGHRCLAKKDLFMFRLKNIASKNYQKNYFQVDTLTFVGAAIKKEAASVVGLPKKEYFIWWDDAEYSLRLLKEGAIYCIPSSVMHHDVVYNNMTSWKDYYGTRNWIDMVHAHLPKRFFYFAVFEKYLKKCSFLAIIFRGRNKGHRKMCREAIKDAINLRLGKNEKYLPK